MAALVNVADYERHARQALPRMVWDYYSSGTRSPKYGLTALGRTLMPTPRRPPLRAPRSGANDQQTLRDNVDAFSRIRLRPRVLISMPSVSLATTVLGHPVASPLLVAPTAMQRMAHPDGEEATARGRPAAGRTRRACSRVSLNSACLRRVLRLAAPQPAPRPARSCA